MGSGVFSKLAGGRFADGLRLGGMIGFARFSVLKVQMAWAEHTGGLGEVRGVTVDANGQPMVGPAHGTGTLSVGEVGPFDAGAAFERVGTSTFDAFIHPSASMMADMVETGLSLLTGRSALSDQLAGIIGGGAYTNIVGHSQGALLVAQAANTLGRGSLAGVNVRLLGGPVSQSYAQRAVALAGGRLEYKANFFDPVPNFLGGQMFRNPARFVSGLAGVPMLAVPSISQHRYQCRPQPAPC